MDRVKRQLVHELAKYYNLETQSIDKEPVRSVVVSRTRDSKLYDLVCISIFSLSNVCCNNSPSVILSEHVARPTGQATQTPSQPQRRSGPSVLHVSLKSNYIISTSSTVLILLTNVDLQLAVLCENKPFGGFLATLCRAIQIAMGRRCKLPCHL